MASIPMAEESAGAAEWENAQDLDISINLVAAAKRELEFLARVHRTVDLKEPLVLRRAVERYLSCWLPLLSSRESDVQLLPPIDCAWIWHCHKLNPVQYGKDCQELVGKLLDMEPDDKEDLTDSELSSEAEQVTIRLWQHTYPSEPYDYNMNLQMYWEGGYGGLTEHNSFARTDVPSASSLAYDLVAAVERQDSFYYQVCRPWMWNDKFLKGALARYKGFLYLIKRAAEKGGERHFLVPTYDIDLLWHAHQLSPTAYRQDTIKCLGKVLDHDDTDSDRDEGQRLHSSFLKTCEQWLETFGLVYEHAGSLYRGPEPTAVPSFQLGGSNQVVIGYPATVDMPRASLSTESGIDLEANLTLSRRQTMQVHLVLFSARNIRPKPGRKTHYFIQVTSLEKCPAMKLKTASFECISNNESEVANEVHWNQGFSMEVEVSTTGLKLELMKYTTWPNEGNGSEGFKFMERMKRKIQSKLNSKAKHLGEIVLNWRTDFLESDRSLCFSKYSAFVNLEKIKVKDQGSNGTSLPDPELHFSVSVTPPSSAPFIFRMLHAPVTDDAGIQVARKLPDPEEKRQEGRWVTRVVTDHRGQEQFVVRTRFARGVLDLFRTPRKVRGEQKVIFVHQGSCSRRREWHYQGQFLIRTPGRIVGMARQLPLAVEHGQSSLHQHWSLLHDALILTINRPDISSCLLDCHIQGNLGSPLRLVSGRRLAYEVMADRQDAEPTTSTEDHKFLTLVRYTPEIPFGKATALINWQTASIEVMPEESVVLVLLIASAITSSLVDMRHPCLEKQALFHSLPIWAQSKMARGNQNDHTDGDLGAVLIERNGLSSVWRRASGSQVAERRGKLLYSNWWDLSDSQITSSGYFGGTQCGSGACGGGACGGGGCTSGLGGACFGGGCGTAGPAPP